MSSTRNRNAIVGGTIIVVPLALAIAAFLTVGSIGRSERAPKAESAPVARTVNTVGNAVSVSALPANMETKDGIEAPSIQNVQPQVAPANTQATRRAEPSPELDLRRAEQVEAQFYADSEPNSESRRMRSVLAVVFDGLAERGVSVEKIECRYRLCRLDLLFESVNADIDVLTDLFVKDKSPEITKFGQAIAPTREYLVGGKVKTTVYIAREGIIEVFD